MNLDVSEKYIFKGEYAEFRGYVFKWGHPTTVTDRATVEALDRRPDYIKVIHETDERGRQEARESGIQAQGNAGNEAVIHAEDGRNGEGNRGVPVEASRQVDPCPKCGKVIGTGRYMHVKFCKGVK